MTARLLAAALFALGTLAAIALFAAVGDRLVDGDQVRVCRQALPAINPDARAITVLSVGRAQAPYALRLAYRVSEGEATRERWVACGFAADDMTFGRATLDRFATEDGPYSPIKVHLLRRYWLQKTALATAADPGPGLSQVPPVFVPVEAAYFVQALANALPSTAVTMLVAVAYALVYGLVGRINLAFGEFAALGAYGALIGWALAGHLGLGWLAASLPLAAACGVAVACLHGRAVERLVFTPLAFGRGQSILVATLALSLVLQDYMRLAQGTQERWVPPLLSIPIPLAGAEGFVATITLMQVAVAVCAGLAALALVALMRLTPFGRAWRATADDPRMAALLGIDPRRILADTFLLATAAAGLGGVVMILNFGGAGFSSGTLIGLKALVAAVVGGIGSVEGALLGGLAVGLFEAAWSAYLPIEQRDLAVLTLLVVALTLRPGGLFGFAETGPRPV